MSNDDDQFALDFDSNAGEMGTASFKSPGTKPVIKVYLAGPLTNNDNQADTLCSDIRAAAKRVFAANRDVHFDAYDPAETTQPGSDHSAEEVYCIDHARTMGADLVLFHVNTPSLGVGIESQIAADATVPRLVAFKAPSSVSRMFLGVFAPTLSLIAYNDVNDFERQLSELLPDVIAGLLQSSNQRRDLMEKLSAKPVGRFLMKRRIALQLSRERLAAETDIREFWLHNLERVPSSAICVTVGMLNRLATVLGCEVTMTGPEITFRPHQRDLTTDARHSLDNLADFVLGLDDPMTDASTPWDRRVEKARTADQRVLRLWAAYVAAYSEPILAARGSRSVTVKALEDWRADYGRLLRKEGELGL